MLSLARKNLKLLKLHSLLLTLLINIIITIANYTLHITFDFCLMN